MARYNSELVTCAECGKEVLPDDYMRGVGHCIWCDGAGTPTNPHKTHDRY